MLVGVLRQTRSAGQSAETKSRDEAAESSEKVEEFKCGEFQRIDDATYSNGLPSWAFCCSVVMMGLSSCFLRFFPLLPLDAAALATCFALLIAAFLMSEPFMMQWQAQARGWRCKE